MSASLSTVRLVQSQDYQFDIHYRDDLPVLRSDEPPPLGAGQGPTPVQQLAGAVGNCLSASLLFALRKFKQSPEPIHTEVTAETGRNAEGRVRVLRMTARLTLGVPAATLQHLDRVLASFEAYCTVTQTVGAAVPITVEVLDSTGAQVK